MRKVLVLALALIGCVSKGTDVPPITAGNGVTVNNNTVSVDPAKVPLLPACAANEVVTRNAAGTDWTCAATVQNAGSLGGKVADLYALKSETLAANGQAVDSAQLGGRPPSSYADAIGGVANSSLRIYGSGSAGDLVASANSALATLVGATGTTQFVNFTVNPGVTLTVDSGTVIRCTGTFTNNGTISVVSSASGGLVYGTGNGGQIPANAGISRRAAGSGDFGPSSFTGTLIGGNGASGLTTFQAVQLLHPTADAGGGGGGGFGANGGIGGGSLLVLARGNVINTGSILADGNDVGARAGGGGGGVVILASMTSISNTSTISATGGNGGASDSIGGAGGGGGGGIIHFIAPVVTNTGTTSVTGGLAGAQGATGSITASPRGAGGGGGASAGNGGGGGAVASGGSPNSASAGTSGQVLTTLGDPTGLF